MLVANIYTLGIAKANNSPSATEMIISGKKKFESRLVRSVIIRVISELTQLDSRREKTANAV